MRHARNRSASPPPRGAALEALGPYARTRLTVRALGVQVPLDVPADVFATRAIDEGTLLLLRNLPDVPPDSLLDLGCGYGAIGLTLAVRHPSAGALLVDRDLLAVRAAAHNARSLGLGGVEVLPSLGYRDVPRDDRFDLVLCNVPARIGPRAIAYFLDAGRALLSARGELRAVVLRDLKEQVEASRIDGLRLVAGGRNHLVYSVSRGSPPAIADDESVYARDVTQMEIGTGHALPLSRPYDASEDPAHPRALRALLDAVPRAPAGTVLCYRCGYGALPLAARTLWPEVDVVAQDRDLLDTAFLRRNAQALSLDGPGLRIVEAVFPSEALPPGRAALVLGESSASAGEPVFARELAEAKALLAPGGEALVLASEKQLREWDTAIVRAGASVLLRREGACVLRLAAARRPARSTRRGA
jgi:16S rRNA (guanine1207-N2)-methyltransferase